MPSIIPPDRPGWEDRILNMNTWMPRCQARSRLRNGGQCRRPARRGYTVCPIHGAGYKKKPGGGPLKHGRYSKFKDRPLGEAIDRFADDPRPLELQQELAVLRALFEDYVERYDEFKTALISWNQTQEQGARPSKVMDLSDASRILTEIGLMVERIERIDLSKAVSLTSLERIMGAMADVVANNVSNKQTQEKILQGWRSIDLGISRD